MSYTPPNPAVYLSTGLVATTGTITSASSTVTVTSLLGVGSATISIYGTYAGVTIAFEVYDGTNWVGIAAAPISTTTPTLVLTAAPGANATALYNVSPLLGVQQFRVRATAWTGGTANINITPSAQFVNYNVNAIVTSAPTTAVTLATNTPTIATGTNTIGGVLLKASTTSSGLLIGKVLSAANTTPFSVKTSAGQLYGWQLVNNATTPRYVRIFNVATSPTMGTNSPYFVLALPAGGGAVVDPGNMGIPFTTGFFYAVTTGSADTDNTAGAAGDVIGTFWYI